MDLLYPTKNIGWVIEESYPVGVKFETKTHRIIVDHICLTEYGEYYITYRAKTKFKYIRSASNLNYSLVAISSESESDEWGNTVTSGSFGEKGYIMFEWPYDDKVDLHCGNKWNLDSQEAVVIELNLEEYWR